jgi:hypothetical protein
MTRRDFQLLRVLGSTLNMKAEADSSNRGQKDFICRKEKIMGAQKPVVPLVRLEIGFL